MQTRFHMPGTVAEVHSTAQPPGDSPVPRIRFLIDTFASSTKEPVPIRIFKKYPVRYAQNTGINVYKILYRFHSLLRLSRLMPPSIGTVAPCANQLFEWLST